MKLNRDAFGRYTITLNKENPDITDHIDVISFKDEEIKELKDMDPRLEVDSYVDGNNYLVAHGQSFLKYHSLGRNCYSAFIENYGFRKDGEFIHLPSCLFILNGFEELKEKVSEYALIRFIINEPVIID